MEGIDHSGSLLAEYSGPASCYIADCRNLPLHDQSRNIAVIHGGLHHLPKPPEDLEAVLSEINRVLEKEGRLVIVELWLTPFLSLIHRVCRVSSICRLSKQIAALATIIELEHPIYDRWLQQPEEILALFDKFFETKECKTAWGKLISSGTARPQL